MPHPLLHFAGFYERLPNDLTTLDVIVGTEDADSLAGTSGDDTISGLGGNDTIGGGGGSDSILGGDGDDILSGGSSNRSDRDTIDGGVGNDSIQGSFGRDHLFGGDNNDTIRGGGGKDKIHGGAGTDFITDIEKARSHVYGDAGDDLIVGDTAGKRSGGLLSGGDGNDKISLNGVGVISWHLEGGSGLDTITGAAGNDTISGGADNDGLGGGGGDDLIRGGGGDDSLFGSAGKDTLIGANGADELTGGPGDDTFKFMQLSDSKIAAPDLITDLESGDQIDLSAIDANRHLAGDQAFVLVSDFDRNAGEACLRYDVGTDTTSLDLDVNGDQVADMRITLSGDQTSFTDFVL